MLIKVKLADLECEIYDDTKCCKIIHKSKNIEDVVVFDRAVTKSSPLDPKIDYSRVLYTLQKDNAIHWIKDWVHFYHLKHQPSVVIIYDNASSSYTLEELQNELSQLPCNVIVKSFPFKYGPKGHKGSYWDSTYCQAAAFEHVRYSLQSKKSILLNVDIDELLFLENNQSIYDEIFSRETDVLLFRGRWALIDPELYNSNEIISFKSHTMIEKKIMVQNM